MYTFYLSSEISVDITFHKNTMYNQTEFNVRIITCKISQYVLLLFTSQLMNIIQNNRYSIQYSQEVIIIIIIIIINNNNNNNNKFILHKFHMNDQMSIIN